MKLRGIQGEFSGIQDHIFICHEISRMGDAGGIE
jgi:hypothetical protein